MIRSWVLVNRSKPTTSPSAFSLYDSRQWRARQFYTIHRSCVTLHQTVHCLQQLLMYVDYRFTTCIHTYYIYIQRVLERESWWVKWKNDGCPPFERKRYAIQYDIMPNNTIQYNRTAGDNDAETKTNDAPPPQRARKIQMGKYVWYGNGWRIRIIPSSNSNIIYCIVLYCIVFTWVQCGDDATLESLNFKHRRLLCWITVSTITYYTIRFHATQ